MKKLLLAAALLVAAQLCAAADALKSTWGAPDLWFAAAISGTNSENLTSTDLGTQYNAIGQTWTPTDAATVTKIGYFQVSATGTPGAGSYSIALYPLTTGGLPNTGATFANATLGSVTVTTFTPPTGGSGTNSWVWVDVSANPYTVTQGQEYAIVMWRNAATDAGNKIVAGGSVPTYLTATPVAVKAAAGTWSKVSITDVPLMAVQTASHTYGHPFTKNAQSGTVYNIDPGFGATTESGMTFTIPTNFGSTVKVKGVRMLLRTPPTSATNTFQVNLYSSPSSSPVQMAKSALIVNDRFGRFGTLTLFEAYFTSTQTLTTGTKYGIGLSTTSATDAYIYTVTVGATADWDAWSYGSQTAYATRTASSFAGIDAGSATGNFSETTTARPAIDLILDDITAPSGSTGFLVQ